LVCAAKAGTVSGTKFAVTLHGKQGLEFLRGVIADGVRRRHHDAGVLQYLIARIVGEDAIEHQGGDQKSDGKGDQDHEIELCCQAHYCGSIGKVVHGLEIDRAAKAVAIIARTFERWCWRRKTRARSGGDRLRPGLPAAEQRG
jgi:hypothetical protein